MNDLRDTRPRVGRTTTDQHGIKGRYAMAASEAVFDLLSGNPNVELATLRFRVDAEFPPKVTVTGRVGSLVGEAGDPGELTYVALPGTECPSCHQPPDRPHTEYCQRLQLPSYWAKQQGITIRDPDGWDRQNFVESWNTPITLEEFHQRASLSTTSTP